MSDIVEAVQHCNGKGKRKRVEETDAEVATEVDTDN